MNLCEIIKQRTAVRCDVKKNQLQQQFLNLSKQCKTVFFSKNCVNRDGERERDFERVSVTERDSERVSVTEREICVI